MGYLLLANPLLHILYPTTILKSLTMIQQTRQSGKPEPAKPGKPHIEEPTKPVPERLPQPLPERPAQEPSKPMTPEQPGREIQVPKMHNA
jgi:hypothetical protein